MNTTRRTFLAGTAAVGATAALPSTAGADPTELPKLAHMVFFWLKNPDSEEDRQKLIAGIKSLGAISTVKGLHVGTPASTGERDVVDNSYSVSIAMFFDSVEAEEAYQVDPTHEKFVAEHAELWRKVVVYDSIAV